MTSTPPTPGRHASTASTVLLTRNLLGNVNRSRIIQALCDHGPLSRAELARLAGVPRATIGENVQVLIDDGLLDDLSPDRHSGRVGKPGRPLWFGRDAGRSVAVVFAPDGVRAALINARGDRLDETNVPVPLAETTPDELVAAVVHAVRAVLPLRSRDRILGVGVAVPGVCDTAAGTVVGSGQVPAAEGDHLTRRVGAAIGLPVLVDNDARVQALGEKWFGDGRGLRTFASVQTGLGLGLGLVLGGHLYRGDDGRTGELGHIGIVSGGERCRCGLTGCWETIATLTWLRREARTRGLRGASGLDAARLVAAAVIDSTAAELLETYADNLAAGLSAAVNLLGTRLFLLHGDAVGGGEELRVRIEAATRRRSLGYLRDDVAVQLSSLDADAALLGAAGLVLSETFTLTV